MLRRSFFRTTGIGASKQRVDDLLSDRPGRTAGILHDFDSSGDGESLSYVLTMMGEHLYDFDTEQSYSARLSVFDENDSGFVKVDE